MEENASALHTAKNSIQALGKGFDVNFDTRLLYCKGVAGSRVVEVDEEDTRDLWLYENLVVPNVTRDIKNSQDTYGRDSSGILNFHEMVEYYNKKANLSGHIPLGNFNAAFSFTGSKHIDAATTKTLCMDGFFLPLAKVELVKSSLVLCESVTRAVPTSWDPPGLASFIENFGTHVITSVTIGGKDVIYVKQHISSPLSTMEIKNYVQEIGNGRFLSGESHTSSGPLKYKEIPVIFRRRGGYDLEQRHTHWASTVKYSPDVIEMSFCPITLLLEGIPGKDHLSRAIALYLEHKPQLEELRYFLEYGPHYKTGIPVIKERNPFVRLYSSA